MIFFLNYFSNLVKLEELPKPQKEYTGEVKVLTVFTQTYSNVIGLLPTSKRQKKCLIDFERYYKVSGLSLIDST